MGSEVSGYGPETMGSRVSSQGLGQQSCYIPFFIVSPLFGAQTEACIPRFVLELGLPQHPTCLSHAEFPEGFRTGETL